MPVDFQEMEMVERGILQKTKKRLDGLQIKQENILVNVL